MLKPNHPTCDVVIIGAGISGLVCGCYLAKAGMKVLMVEQHDKPGGYFTSFRRKGLLFDAAAHSFGNYRAGGHVRKIFTEVGVDRIIKIERFNPSDVVVNPDFSITFWNDQQNTIKSIGAVFPHETENVARFFDFLTSSPQTEFSKLKNKTFGALLSSFFKDERLIHALAIPVFGNGGLPPAFMHAFSGSKIFSEFILDGGYYPEGGMQNLPDALDQIIKENGGVVWYRRLVKKIIHEGNVVQGIELDNGEKIMAKYVVSACDMTQTYESLIGKEAIDEGVLKSLHAMTPSLSNLILYIGIDHPFAGLPHPGTNTWYLPYCDLNEMYEHIQQCNFAKAGMFMLRVAPDQRTILAFMGAPFKTASFWRENKEKIMREFFDRVVAFMPGLKEHVIFLDAATPATLYKYTLNYSGASFGWAKTVSQTFDQVFSKTTFIKGLYLTGHWTSIAFGMPGTCYSGSDTAKRILRKEKLCSNPLHLQKNQLKL